MGQVDLVRLSMLMRRAGLGPTELANKAGIAPAAVTRIFRGADPRGTTLAKIAEALNASVDYLLGRNESSSGQTPEGDLDDLLDMILKDRYGYDYSQIEAVRSQLEAFSTKPFNGAMNGQAAARERNLQPAMAM